MPLLYKSVVINVVCHEIDSLGYVYNFTMILSGTMNASAGIFWKILLSNSLQQDAKQSKPFDEEFVYNYSVSNYFFVYSLNALKGI